MCSQCSFVERIKKKIINLCTLVRTDGWHSRLEKKSGSSLTCLGLWLTRVSQCSPHSLPLFTSEMSWRANGTVPRLTKFTLVVQPPDGGKKTCRIILDQGSQKIAKTVLLRVHLAYKMQTCCFRVQKRGLLKAHLDLQLGLGLGGSTGFY